MGWIFILGLFFFWCVLRFLKISFDNVYEDFKQREKHTVLNNSKVNVNPHSCDKQGKSIQVIIAIFIKYNGDDRLFLWNLLVA